MVLIICKYFPCKGGAFCVIMFDLFVLPNWPCKAHLLPLANCFCCPYRFCCLFMMAFLGVLYPYNRGTLLTSLVKIYTLTSAVAGYSSASFYSQFIETGWVTFINFLPTFYFCNYCSSSNWKLFLFTNRKGALLCLQCSFLDHSS